MRFSRNRSSVTLLTDPAFLGKNQIPDRGAEPIFIPALPENSDSHSLCPVRILTAYLSRTKSLRSGNNRLFISIKKDVSDLSVKTISTWICKTISLAYAFSDQSALVQHTVEVHDDLFSFGPIVSSQIVNFPPVSSVTRDSVLC